MSFFDDSERTTRRSMRDVRRSAERAIRDELQHQREVRDREMQGAACLLVMLEYGPNQVRRAISACEDGVATAEQQRIVVKLLHAVTVT